MLTCSREKCWIKGMTETGGKRILFMGSDPIAIPMLNYILEERPAGVELCAVVSQPDRRSGRGLKQHRNAIKRWSDERGIAVIQPAKCGDEVVDLIEREKIHLSLVMAYGQMLPKRVLEAPELGTVNLHASLLPKYRGPSPIHTAIANGEKATGVSLMRITPKMDAGPVGDREEVSIHLEDQAPEVIKKISEACVPLMKRCLPALMCGELKFVEQNPDEVLYCRIIHREDANVDFHRTAMELHDHIRAFQPWPGAQFPCRDAMIKIGGGRPVEPHFENGALNSTGIVPGTVLRPDEHRMQIICGNGCLEILEMQRPGHRMISTDAFLRGFPIEAETVLESRPMRPLVQTVPFRKKPSGDSQGR